MKLKIGSDGKLTFDRKRDLGYDTLHHILPNDFGVSVWLVSATWAVPRLGKITVGDAILNQMVSGVYGEDALRWAAALILDGRICVSPSSRFFCYAKPVRHGGHRLLIPLSSKIMSQTGLIVNEEPPAVYWVPFGTGDIYEVSCGSKYSTLLVRKIEDFPAGSDRLTTVSVKLRADIG